MINPEIKLAHVNASRKNTMIELLGIEVTELGKDYLIGKMPVDKRTHQPAGLLHGGASAAMIESLGSLGSSMIVDMSKYGIVGIEINANHLRPVREGLITAVTRPIHIGRTTQVWHIELFDQEGKPSCISRMTAGEIGPP